MAKYDKKSQDKVEKAMHEYKRGELKSGSGKKVKSKDQAIAIGLSEARKEGSKAPKKAKSESGTKSKSSSAKSKSPSAKKKSTTSAKKASSTPTAKKRSSTAKASSRKRQESTFVGKTAKQVKGLANDVMDFVEDTTKQVKKKVKKAL